MGDAEGEGREVKEGRGRVYICSSASWAVANEQTVNIYVACSCFVVDCVFVSCEHACVHRKSDPHVIGVY